MGHPATARGDPRSATGVPTRAVLPAASG